MPYAADWECDIIRVAMARIVRVHAAVPDFRAKGCALKFILTYEGSLRTGGRKAAGKHERRTPFHHQLKRLWNVNPLLKNWRLPLGEHEHAGDALAVDVLAPKHAIGGFEFVPLITGDLFLEAALHFHILRPTTFKGEVADTDNILKNLIDSLKMPQHAGELPSDAQPRDNEKPFFVLMQDDSLLFKITSTTDELLQPVCAKEDIERGDMRIMIDVNIRPTFLKSTNQIFFSDDFEIWNHNFASPLGDIRSWSNAELKARTTQCVLRMRVTASNFTTQRSSMFNIMEQTPASDDDFSKSWSEQNSEHRTIWNLKLRPVALALKEELERRVGPHPSGSLRMHAIEYGMLAGVDPIGDAAVGLESLMRQLP